MGGELQGRRAVQIPARQPFVQRQEAGVTHRRPPVRPRALRRACPPEPPPQPDTADSEAERLTQPQPPTVQKHGHRIHR